MAENIETVKFPIEMDLIEKVDSNDILIIADSESGESKITNVGELKLKVNAYKTFNWD